MKTRRQLNPNFKIISIENQVLKDVAEGLEDQIKIIQSHPSAMLLIPVALAVAKIQNLKSILEELAK